MGKIFKIRLKRKKESELKPTCYSYPQGYNFEKISPLVYESQGAGQDVIKRGGKEEYILAIVDDAYAETIRNKKDFEEIDYKAALELGERWFDSRPKIRDVEKVAEIIAKLMSRPYFKAFLAHFLSESEINALDPDHPEEGVNRKTWKEVLDRFYKP